MEDFLEFTFLGFWHFVGMTILLNGLAYFTVNGLLKFFVRLFRMITVALRGWPPPHLDADGDWKPAKEATDE